MFTWFGWVPVTDHIKALGLSAFPYQETYYYTEANMPSVCWGEYYDDKSSEAQI